MHLRFLATFIAFISVSVDVVSLSTNPLPTTGVFSLNVALYVKEERREEFIKCIQANQEGTLTAEPLALQYDWFVYLESLVHEFCYSTSLIMMNMKCCLRRGESTTERNTFYFHEQYKSKAGFDAHTEAPHFKV